MFEKICVQPIEPRGTYFDLGFIAEALLFYGETYLIVSESSLPGVIRQFGPDLLFRLMDEHQLCIRYRNHDFGTFIKNKGTPSVLYDVGLIHLENSSLDDAAQKAFIEVIGKSGKGRRLSARFCQKVGIIEYPESITKDIMEDMKCGIHIEEYIKRRLLSLGAIQSPQEVPKFKYRFTLDPGKGFVLDTDLQPDKMGNKISEITDPSTVLTHYGTTVANMSLWAQVSSEVAVYPRDADVIAARLETMLKAYRQNQAQVERYQEFILDNSKAIREAINSGAREFNEFVPILERAKRFKGWLSDLPKETELLKQYYKDVTANSWVDQLPEKSFRWALFTGAGLSIDAAGAGGIGIASGVALSMLDTFFLDRLLKGWRPHQFIEGPLRKFVDS